MEDVFFHHDQGRKGHLTLADVRHVMTPATFEDFAAIGRHRDGAITKELAVDIQRGHK